MRAGRFRTRLSSGIVACAGMLPSRSPGVGANAAP